MPRVRRIAAGRDTVSARKTPRLLLSSRQPGTRRVTPIVAALLILATLATAGMVGGAQRLLLTHGDALGNTSGLHASSGGNPIPSLPAVSYAHSWYVDDALNTAAAMSALGASDAQWLNTQTTKPNAASNCPADFLTVLDFGHPTRAFTGHTSPLDDYAMSLFGHQESWRTYRQAEQLAKSYLDAWVAAASACPRLRLVMGTSNFNECSKAVGACDVSTAGQYWDIVTHDVMDYVATKGYAQVSGVWVGDDLEASWDPWTTTLQFLTGVRNQERTYSTHARLVDYGDAQVGACSSVTGRCANPWTAENVYAAAWGMGWDVPLPETYDSTTTKRWEDVAASQHPENPMAYIGVMTECAGSDPLPTRPCPPQTGINPGSGACEWSPAIAYNHMQAADTSHSLTYATNIQWPDVSPSAAPASVASTSTPTSSTPTSSATASSGASCS